MTVNRQLRPSSSVWLLSCLNLCAYFGDLYMCSYVCICVCLVRLHICVHVSARVWCHMCSLSHSLSTILLRWSNLSRDQKLTDEGRLADEWAPGISLSLGRQHISRVCAWPAAFYMCTGDPQVLVLVRWWLGHLRSPSPALYGNLCYLLSTGTYFVISIQVFPHLIRMSWHFK